MEETSMAEATTGFTAPIDARYFEDYLPGSVQDFDASTTIEQDRLLSFATEFDPQTMHTDPEAAAEGPFGGLIASGWHTAGVLMRLFADNYLSHVASLGGLGIDELRWPAPVRPGDTLRLRTTVLDATRSRSKPDRGVVRTRAELRNQRGETVLSLVAINLLGLRDPG
jgi:acyl dehydratase